MTQKRTLREALAARSQEPVRTPVRSTDRHEQETFMLEQADRYRNFVASVNRASDAQIERALQSS